MRNEIGEKVRFILVLFVSILINYSFAFAQTAEEYVERGIEKYEQQDFAGSILEFSSAIKRDSNYKWAYYNRAITKESLKDYSGAIQDYSKAIEIDTNYVTAYNNRGYVRYNLKEYKAAKSDYKKATEINPK